MDRAAALSHTSDPAVQADRLGERRPFSPPGSRDGAETLCLRRDLAGVAAFEFALRERVARLSGFRHPAFVRVRSVERLPEPGAPLALVCDRASGLRLSELLTKVDPDVRPLDITSTLRLTRQLAAALAALHEHAREIAHGAVSLERLLVTPNARLLVTDYAMGSALERLAFSHDRYWAELRVAVPPQARPPRLDERTDVLQLGLVALELVLGRPIGDEEYPSRVPELVASAWAVSARGGLEPLPAGVRRWLVGALQLDPRGAFSSVNDARTELDAVVNAADLAGSSNLEALLASVFVEPLSTAPAFVRPPAAQPALERESAPVTTAPTPVPAAAADDVAVPAPMDEVEESHAADEPLTAVTGRARRMGAAAAAVLAGVIWIGLGWVTPGARPPVAEPLGVAVPGAAGIDAALAEWDAAVEAAASEPAQVAQSPAPPQGHAVPATGDPGAGASLTDPEADAPTAAVLASSDTSALLLAPADPPQPVVPDAPPQTGTVSLNAVPWAEVWIRGEKVGDTPMANLPLPVGTHEITFRHPDLGEQTRTVTVTTTESARVSVDLRPPR
jgi:hypothetical protein